MTGIQSAGSTLQLPGLDGSNPLAFLAAVGLLRIVDHRSPGETAEAPRLSWVDEGYWQPRIHGCGDLEKVIAAILEDTASWSADPALLLAYDATGEKLLDPREANGRCNRDLKPKPAAFREFLERAARGAEVGSLDPFERLQLRRTMDTVAAFGSECVQDNNGNTKPTAFHFTAGQQRFLDMIVQLQAGVGRDDFMEALLGPWRGHSRLPSLSWDSTIARIYALRATDPSAEKRGSVPGAEWLAFVGMGLFLSVPRNGALRTTGFRGGWKNGAFAWPVWSPATTLPVVRSLLTTRDLRELGVEARNARGIDVVFESAVTRSDQGGYGGFTPAKVV